jgi:predicted transcriptional regulator
MEKYDRKKVEDIQKAVKESVGDDTQISVHVHRQKIGKVPDFVMMFQEVLKIIVMSKDMSASTYRVFVYICSMMSFENYMGVSVETICEDLELSLSSVQRALKQMKKMGVIITLPDQMDKRKNNYILNPLAVWKGKVKSRTEVMRKLTKLDKDLMQLSLFSPVQPDAILLPHKE